MRAPPPLGEPGTLEEGPGWELRRSSLVARRSSLVARRSSLVAYLSLALGLTIGGTGLATPLSARTQLGVSRSYVWAGGADYWSVWARRSDGHLVGLRLKPDDPTPMWTDYGWVNNHSVGAQGVSATSWNVGGTQYERIYYLDGNNLIEAGLENRVQNLGRNLGAPANRNLTGYLAVSRRFDSGSGKNFALVFFTTKDAANPNLVRLYLCQIDTTNNAFTWHQLGTETDYSASFPIAASSSTDGTYARAFAGTTSGTLRHVRWNGASAFVLSLSQPANASVCSTIATAEGDLGGATGYRAYVFCTQRGATEGRVRFRYSTSAVGDLIGNWSAWSSINAPAGQGNVVNSGYALAATYRGGTAKNIDLFALSDTSALLAATTPAGGGALPPQMTALGDDGESWARQGGLAATPAVPLAGGASHLHYFGTGSDHLLRVTADPAQTGVVGAWQNHGTSVGQGAIAVGPASEPSTAFYRQHAVATFMSPTDSTTPMQVFVSWSHDGGETWSAPSALPLNLGAEVNTNAADVSVAFTDTGRAYILFLAADRNGTCSQLDSSEVSLLYTDNFGVNYTYLAMDSRLPLIGGQVDNALDYPNVAIEQRAGQADVVHMVWADRDYDNDHVEGSGVIRYRRAVDPVVLGGGGALYLTGVPNDLYGGAVPRVTVGAQGAVYVAWNWGLCRIDWLTWNSCRAFRAWNVGTDRSQSRWMPIPVGPSEPQGAKVPATGQIAVVASRQNPNRVYVAFQRAENESNDDDTDELDLYFEIIDFDPVTNTFLDPGPRYSLTGIEDDSADQFGPELTVTNDDRVFATWYDRGESCTVGGQQFLNRCYRAKRAIWRPSVLAFGYVQEIPVTSTGLASDPLSLPSRCPGSPNERFLGDYHRVVGDRLHSYHTVVAAPLGSPTPTADLVRGWVSPGYWYW